MRRISRLSLTVALGLSLLVHLALLPLVRSPAEPQPEESTGPVALETRPPRPTPLPTPPPTPKPTPTPAPTARPRTTPPPQHAARTPPRPTIHAAHQSTRVRGLPAAAADVATGVKTDAGNGAGFGPPAPPGDAAAAAPAANPATPVPTLPPRCAQPDVPAVTIDPVVPQTPALAEQQGISGDVTVIVSLDEFSHVVGARVATSPSALLNDAAMRAARDSRFRTEIRDCRPVAADYAFIVEFTAQ